MELCAVILAGGTGSRLWPTSRALYPKQLLAIQGKDTMLQSTVKRLSDLSVRSCITVCNEEHRFFVAEQLREIDSLDQIVLEPMGRNTAPAIALAALSAKDDPILLVLPADHVIGDKQAFSIAISSAIPLAQSGKLVTFGIVPSEPNTGYGYIKSGAILGCGFVVDSFHEKPTVSVAEKYMADGGYFWNSGMFLFKASHYLRELKKFRPDIYDTCVTSVETAKTDLDFLRIDESQFLSCPSESIDVAVMENTLDAVVVPMNAEWSDIGSWSSIWDIADKDCNGNVTHGDILLHNTSNSYVRTDGSLVAAIGVDNLVIVASKDAVLVSHKSTVQDVKVITEKLKVDSRSEVEVHCEVHRPWGKYESIDHGQGYQVKRITVKPGAKLSLQFHHYRAEHWIVVSGTARVTIGDKNFLLAENESTYIPVGEIHALENPGNVDLELIEVQSGVYLGEDDIVRLEDIYGRS